MTLLTGICGPGLIGPQVLNSTASICEVVRGGIALGADGTMGCRACARAARMANDAPRHPAAGDARDHPACWTSSFLSLTKNSSLAVAIGFPDLASIINTSANQTGQAAETLFILVAGCPSHSQPFDIVPDESLQCASDFAGADLTIESATLPRDLRENPWQRWRDGLIGSKGNAARSRSRPSPVYLSAMVVAQTLLRWTFLDADLERHGG